MTVFKLLPLSRHKVALHRAFERTALIASVGFALAAGSAALSLAVATSLFGSSDAETMTRLKNAADALSIAAGIYGLGFTTSVVAMLIPISHLEQIHHDQWRWVPLFRTAVPQPGDELSANLLLGFCLAE